MNSLRPNAKSTDAEFIQAWHASGGEARKVADLLNANIRSVYDRRKRIEERTGASLPSAGLGHGYHRGDAGTETREYMPRLQIDGYTGSVVVFSDAHYHPGIGETIAHQALLRVIAELKPRLVVANGDIFDGARVSRFPRNGWEPQPRMVDELEEVKARMAEVRHAFRGARLLRTVGNHCIRFDRYLSAYASEMEGIAGARLADHLPEWEECMSVFVNGNTMIKHRFNGGIHAGYNNTLRAGTNIVTGHTHHLEVKPWGDYRGRRYGVQTGALADIDGPQFAYTENNPTPWCSGFAVLTFDKDGDLLPPELAEVIGGACFFRGKIIAGKKGRRPA